MAYNFTKDGNVEKLNIYDSAFTYLKTAYFYGDVQDFSSIFYATLESNDIPTGYEVPAGNYTPVIRSMLSTMYSNGNVYACYYFVQISDDFHSQSYFYQNWTVVKYDYSSKHYYGVDGITQFCQSNRPTCYFYQLVIDDSNVRWAFLDSNNAIARTGAHNYLYTHLPAYNDTNYESGGHDSFEDFDIVGVNILTDNGNTAGSNCSPKTSLTVFEAWIRPDVWFKSSFKFTRFSNSVTITVPYHPNHMVFNGDPYVTNTSTGTTPSTDCTVSVGNPYLMTIINGKYYYAIDITINYTGTSITRITRYLHWGHYYYSSGHQYDFPLIMLGWTTYEN